MSDKSESPEEDGQYVSNSSFVELFGKPSRVKILDVLLGKHDSLFTASEIASFAGISHSTVTRNIDELVAIGVVSEKSGSGHPTAYRVNKESPISKHLAAIRRSTLDHAGTIHEQFESVDETIDNAGTQSDVGLQGLLQAAVENSEKEQRQVDVSLDGDSTEPSIAVVGCGGAGNNTINRLYNIGIEGAETIALNTDRNHLGMIEADTKILIDNSDTNGLGTGGDPQIGKEATEQAEGTLSQVLNNTDLVFVTAGMGGGTGTGAAPVVSRIAKQQGALVVSVVSTPFEVERVRLQRAKNGIEELNKEADSVIVLNYNRLLDQVSNIPIGKAFSVMDQIIAENIRAISETITQPSLINFDFEELSTTLSQGGISSMLIGETEKGEDSQNVVADMLNHSLLDADYSTVTGGLVHITGGVDLTLRDAESIAHGIADRLDKPVSFTWGARAQEAYEGKVRAMLILTGVDAKLELTTDNESPMVDEAQKSSNLQREFDASKNFKQSQQDSGEDNMFVVS